MAESKLSYILKQGKRTVNERWKHLNPKPPSPLNPPGVHWVIGSDSHTLVPSKNQHFISLKKKEKEEMVRCMLHKGTRVFHNRVFYAQSIFKFAVNSMSFKKGE